MVDAWKKIARLLGMAGCALGLIWPASAPVLAKVFEPETFVLGNGMQVVVISDHRVPVVGHWVWYRVGAADAPYGKSGISHFFEHLMFKGTPGVPPGEFSKLIARNGGRDNAFTSQDYTAYFQNLARDRLELAMRLEADRMANLVLTDAVVAPELQVVLEERLSRTDNDPGARLGEQMTAALYLNHPYGRPIIGWEHELRTLGLADALAFYKAHYAPNNAILIVSGDVTAAEVKPLAEKYYGVIPARPVAARQRPQEPPRVAERRVVLEDAAVRQPSVSRSYHAPSRASGATEHAVPLVVLAEILGGQTGRLHKRLIQDGGIAASASAWYDDVAVDSSRFSLSASPKAGKTVAEAEAALDKAIAELLKDGVTAAEVTRAKTNLLAQAVFARDSSYVAVRAFGEALTAGMSVADVEAWPELIAKVTAEQILAAARHVFDRRGSVTGVLLPEPAS